MELITKHQAAELAGVHPDTIRRWQANGELHAYARRQPSGQISDMVDKAELLRLEKVVKRAPATPLGKPPRLAGEPPSSMLGALARNALRGAR